MMILIWAPHQSLHSCIVIFHLVLGSERDPILLLGSVPWDFAGNSQISGESSWIDRWFVPGRLFNFSEVTRQGENRALASDDAHRFLLSLTHSLSITCSSSLWLWCDIGICSGISRFAIIMVTQTFRHGTKTTFCYCWAFLFYGLSILNYSPLDKPWFLCYYY